MKYLKTIYVLISWTILKSSTLASENPVFLVTEKECITNSSSAIAFNTPVEETQNIQSDFFPLVHHQYLNIDCAIEDTWECTRLWTSEHWRIANSIDGPIKKPITDWRWEALPIYTTKQIHTNDGTTRYDEYTFSEENFDIPLSVRTEQDAIVIFRQDPDVYFNFDYYLLILQSYEGTSTLIKCSTRYNNYGVNRNDPQTQCFNPVKDQPGLVSEDSWTHFRIINVNNTVMLFRDKERLFWFELGGSFHLRDMIFHSDKVGLWKIHNYSYIYSTSKLREGKGPQLTLIEGQNCISMFVVMCSRCGMRIELQSYNGTKYSERYTTQDENWKQIKILLNLTTSETMQLFVTTESPEDSGIFWAIDHIRSCSEKEYRILKLPSGRSGIPCQNVENKNTLNFQKLQDAPSYTLDTNCPESTFGRQCIPCQIFGNSLCYSSKYYCEKFNKNIQCYHTTRSINRTPERSYDVMGTWGRNNDLRISWKHPKATNGSIEKFTISIELNHSFGKPKQIGNFTKYIKSGDDYSLTYTYQIKHIDIIPCSRYTVIVRAHNKQYSSVVNAGAQFTDWSPPPIPPNLPEEELKIENTSHTITIKIPRLEYTESNGIYFQKKLYMLVAESVNTKEINDEISNFEHSLRKKQKAPVLTYHRLFESDIEMSKSSITFKIVNDSVMQTGHLSNLTLERGKAYTVDFFFVNECHGYIRLNKVEKNVYTSGYVEESDGLYPLILLILLVPLLAFVYMYIKRKKETTPDIFTIFNQPQNPTAIVEPRKHRDGENLPSKEPPKLNLVVKPRKSAVTMRTCTKTTDMYQKVKPAFLLVDRLDIPPTHIKKGGVPPVIKTTYSKSMKISDFELYLRESLENEELVRQHELFPRGKTKPWEYGNKYENRSKNRYNNLIAYDHSRVKLSKIPGDKYSDYINANYIDGYRSASAYIATQGPKANTITDFWRMIWTENVKHIIMLTNIYEGLEKKVDKYWPDLSEEKDFNGIKVTQKSRQVFANYEFRVFKVYHNNMQRRVEQLHFTTWPDHGVPLYSQSLAPFLQRLLKIPNDPNSPIVVHCSAGVGRTGTIILCDICLRMASAEGSVDFLANLENLRRQRANMVDNVEQYILAHLVVLECLFGKKTSIICDEEMQNSINNLISSDGIKTQMKYLVDTEWQDKVLDTYADVEETPSYPEKNRFQDIVADERHRVYLVRYPPQDECSSYINAIKVDGFRSPGRYIVTQQPMPNTLGDFWRLIAEQKSTMILSLNEINESDQTSCQFWPDKNSEMKPVDYLTICYVNSTLSECYRIITVRVKNLKQDEDLLVNIIFMNNWMPTDLLPNSVEKYMLFWEKADALTRQCDPVVVTCYNGATASGLYIATSFLIEKMKLEHECDVCLAVRTIRHNRKQFVTSEEQFEFLYRASLMYINSFQFYANFA